MFGKIWNFIKGVAKKVFSSETLDIVSKVYPIVKAVAVLTPNRTDDEILAVAEKYGVSIFVDPAKDYHEKGLYLKEIVVEYASEKFGIDEALLAAAVQAAYDKLTSEGK